MPFPNTVKPRIRTPGDPFSILAREANYWTDGARRAMQLQSAVAGFGSNNLFGKSNLIAVRNDTGEDFEQYQPAQLVDQAFGPSDNPEEFKTNPVMLIEKPTRRAPIVGICIDKIPNGEGGLVLIEGFSFAEVRIRDEEHRYARPAHTNDDPTTWESCAYGMANIINPPSGTGNQDMILYFNPQRTPALIYEVSGVADHGDVWDVTNNQKAVLGASLTPDTTIGLVIDVPDTNELIVLGEGVWCDSTIFTTDQALFLDPATPGAMTTANTGDGDWRMLLTRGFGQGWCNWYPRLQRKTAVCIDDVETDYWIDMSEA